MAVFAGLVEGEVAGVVVDEGPQGIPRGMIRKMEREGKSKEMEKVSKKTENIWWSFLTLCTGETTFLTCMLSSGSSPL